MDVESAVPPLQLPEARDLLARREWKTLSERAAALAPEQLVTEPELGYLCANAWTHTGAVDRALELMHKVDPKIRVTGNRRLTLQATNLFGALLFEAGRTAEAEERFGELLDNATDWKDDEYAARASNNLGVLANVRGEKERSLTCYQRALAAYQRLGSLRGLAQTHYNLGVAYRELSFSEEAEAHYAQAIRYAQESGSEDVVGLAESDRGLLCILTGDPQKGEVFARLAHERFQRIGDPVRAGEAMRVLAAAARAMHRVHDARTLLEDALAAARVHSNPLLLAELHRDYGSLLHELGEVEGARAALHTAIEHFTRLGAAAETTATQRLLDALPG